ncbi:hypothetical protein ACGF07_32095 [Kitasatospora sp. NPDC048194]|uniref:hypothetical protein n=1 Tax=Kitasatospora sp. NPDC048194 TaxID=3364045 RepID=UPI0037154769
MNNDINTVATDAGYTEEELDRAVALFIENQLKPAAARTGRPLGELLDEVADDLFDITVLAYMMAGRDADAGRIEPDAVQTRAAVYAVGMLRKLPGRESLAARVVSSIYRQARAAAGVVDGCTSRFHPNHAASCAQQMAHEAEFAPLEERRKVCPTLATLLESIYGTDNELTSWGGQRFLSTREHLTDHLASCSTCRGTYRTFAQPVEELTPWPITAQ